MNEHIKERIVSPPLNEIKHLPTPLTDGEEQVLRLLLSKLDPDWEIYVQPHLNGNRPDFVLLKPSVGLAVFEVKDWNLQSEYYGSRGKYISPIDKIKLYRDEISSLYLPSIESTNAYACITAGIIFTKASTNEIVRFCSTLRGYDPTSKHNLYEPISGKDEIENEDIDKIFPQHLRTSSVYMNETVASDFRNWLYEPDVSADQRRTPKLDQHQITVASTRTQTGYRRVKGPAGSGKSLVLAARAAYLMDEGKHVLIITFNITLLNFLRDLSVRFKRPSLLTRNNATWYNFHFWCKRVIYAAGRIEEYNRLWRNDPNAQGFDDIRLEETLPNLTESCLSNQINLIKKYDAVLVDEGQDLNPKWWNLLRKVLNDNGEMLLVSDSTQDIYEKGKFWTDEAMTNCGFYGPWTIFKGSYRIPRELRPYLVSFSRTYLPKEKTIEPEEPDNQFYLEGLNPIAKLKWVQVSKNKLTKISIKEIFKLLTVPKDNPLPVPDITFLSSEKEICKDVVSELETKIKVIHTFHEDERYERNKKLQFYRGSARVKITTLHSFKGMENRALVLCIPNSCSKSLIYTGLSRLKQSEVEGHESFLTVVCCDNEFVNYGKTWPKYVEK